MSNFWFLKSEFQEIWDSADRAEKAVIADSRVSCFYARRSIELMVKWLYVHDGTLTEPYDTKLAVLMDEPCFKELVPPQVRAKMQMLRLLGNRAVHKGRAPTQYDALQAARDLFHCGFWLVSQYTRSDPKALDGLEFNADIATKAPAVAGGAPTSNAELKKLEQKLEDQDKALTEEKEKAADYEAKIKLLQAEIAAVKKINETTPLDHDYNEAATRDKFIDLLLQEAGWDVDFNDGTHKMREFKVTGMPNEGGDGYVDYVLWDKHSRYPLAVVEAKRTKKDARIGKNRASLYANCLEAKYGVRPVIFYTNGYEHWIWDDQRYPPRSIQGFLKESELELMIQRRKTAADLSAARVDKSITDRYYSEQAIRHITEAMMQKHRKALVVMATGSGKTRMVIALIDLLQRSNWTLRVLFLADRVALVKQALNAFKSHLPHSNPVNLVSQKEAADSRVYASTYPTMMGLIDETSDDGKRFGVGHFDLVICDEAHRSIYQKYRAIFQYFDACLVGLTATPRDEVDRDTYSLFDLQKGVPTYAYELEQAVEDGHLVPPKLVSVPIQFPREGIRYDSLSDEEKEEWDLVEWDEEGNTPDSVAAAAVNKWLFNIDTVDKVLAHVMTDGLRVDQGMKIGKTIIFAKNHNHAMFIEERFNANYPHLKGNFARVIDNREPYAQDLIEKFSIQKNPPKDAPQIAISVDMLDTGIDVPDVVNLVFFKIVRSKTKFWQMIGRGTRLRENLFGPGKDKEFFYVFDYCGNFEYFNEHPEGASSVIQESIGTRIFQTRLSIVQSLSDDVNHDTRVEMFGENGIEKKDELKKELVTILHRAVVSMNVDNFIVRPKRRAVEAFQMREIWNQLTPEDYADLHNEIAFLPTEQEPEHPSAKYFDFLILSIQLAMLEGDPAVARLRTKVREIAGKLEEVERIPEVKKQIVLIQELQSDEYWEHVTLPMLDVARKNLRDLIQHIESGGRNNVITNFEDIIGEGTVITLPRLGAAIDKKQYKRKFESFLKDRESNLSLMKVKHNEPLSRVDLEELERLFFESGDLGSRADFEACFGDQESLPVFIRKLVGLDREAAKKAFGEYLDTTTFNANQINFVNQVIDYLTKNGVMDPGILFKHPFTNSGGPTSLFKADDASKLMSIIRAINDNAAAA